MVAQAAVRAGRAFLELYIDDKVFNAVLDKATSRVTSFGETIRGIGAKVAGVGAVITAPFLAASFAASDLQESLNKFEQVFGSQSKGAKQFADDLSGSMGRAKGDILDALSAFQSGFIGSGASPDVARQFSQELTQLAIDFGSFNNVADNEAIDRFTSALSGSSEVVDRYGIDLKQAALDQELLRLGFDTIAGGASELEKRVARLSIIRETLGRQGALGDAQRTIGEFAGQMRVLNGTMKRFVEAIGGAVLPVVKTLAQGVNLVLSPLATLAETFPTVSRIVAIAGVGMITFGAAITAMSAVLTIGVVVVGVYAKGLLFMGTSAIAAALGFTRLAAAITAVQRVLSAGALLAGAAKLLGKLLLFGIVIDLVIGLGSALKGLWDSFSGADAATSEIASLDDAIKELQNDAKGGGKGSVQDQLRAEEESARRRLELSKDIASNEARLVLSGHALKLELLAIEHKEQRRLAAEAGQDLKLLVQQQQQERLLLAREEAAEKARLARSENFDIREARIDSGTGDSASKEIARQKLAHEREIADAQAAGQEVSRIQARQAIEQRALAERLTQEKIARTVATQRDIERIEAESTLKGFALRRRLLEISHSAELDAAARAGETNEVFKDPRGSEELRARQARERSLLDEEERQSKKEGEQALANDLARINAELELSGFALRKRLAEIHHREELQRARRAGEDIGALKKRQAAEDQLLAKEGAEEQEQLARERASILKQLNEIPSVTGVLGGQLAELSLFGSKRNLDKEQLDELKRIRQEEAKTRQAIEQLKPGVRGV